MQRMKTCEKGLMIFLIKEMQSNEESGKTLFPLLVKMQTCKATLLVFLKIGNSLLHDTDISLLGIYPKNTPVYHKNI